LLAVAIGAEELVLLTDVDRLYSSDPRTDARAVPIEEVSDPSDLERLQEVAGGGGQWGWPHTHCTGGQGLCVRGQ
jgi:glutamate 5-kinase